MEKLPLAIPFKYGNDEYNGQIKEFNVAFLKDINSLDNFLVFLDTYPDTRVNVHFPKGIPISIVKAINRVSDKVYVRVQREDWQHIQELKEEQIKFFLDKDFPAYNYTTLDTYIRLGITDLYIADDLCYNLEEVKKRCDQANIQLRLVLNKVPSTAVDRGINPKSPFFRPQDIVELEKYFGVFEFDCGYKYEWHKFKVLKKVWFDKGNWIGELSEINDDIELSFPNRSIYPYFTNFKLNCKRRCDMRLSNSCKKCYHFLNIGWKMDEKGYFFSKPKTPEIRRQENKEFKQSKDTLEESILGNSEEFIK